LRQQQCNKEIAQANNMTKQAEQNFTAITTLCICIEAFDSKSYDTPAEKHWPTLITWFKTYDSEPSTTCL